MARSDGMFVASSVQPAVETSPPAPAGQGSASEGDEAPRHRGRPLTLLLAGHIALGLLVAVTTGVLVIQSRQTALTEATHTLRSLALVLAGEADRTLEAADLAQTDFMQRAGTGNMKTPDEFRQRLSGLDVHRELDSQGNMVPRPGIIALTDAEGKFTNISGVWPVPEDSVADQAFFQALKAGHSVSAFFQNGKDDTRAVVIARGITSPEGIFLGAGLVSVPMTYFEQLYRTAAGGDETSIALLQKNGVLAGITAELAADSGVILRTSPIDGLERLIAGHSLAHYPMVVAASATVSSILTAWRKQASYQIGTAVILELAMLAVVLLMPRWLRAQSMQRDGINRMLNEARGANAEAEARLSMAHERERAGQELGIQNVRFRAALNNMSQALVMFDAAGGLIVANGRLIEMFGNSEPLTPGSTIETILGRALFTTNLGQADLESMRASIQQLQAARMQVSRVRELADGRALAVNFVPVEGDGWLVTLEDITERRMTEARITHMAHHDALTGLPNRIQFHEKLTDAVARSQRGAPCAVLYLDLDQFKAVNDTLGHPVGDALLREVTNRLLREVRETDAVARLGGDEFAIVQSAVGQPENVTSLAQRIIEAIGQPYELNGHHVTIGTSIGIAVYPEDGEDPDQLLKNADMALYSAKAEGRGRYRFFEPEMDALMQARRTLELDLRKALTAEEFEVWYQPLMNIKTRSVSGFEALVRWNHAERGLVTPAEFVPLAEDIGLIIPLGKWVLSRACADAASWPGAMKVAVNVSVVQFGSHTLVEDVAAALAASGLDPGRLELEITETVMLEDTDAILVILHQLRDLGVGIAMDDFGTGYSSLSYLRRFPFSKVKIDRSFIEGLGNGGDCDAIVKAVTELCETLGMATLAEGVETEEQLLQLQAGNCGEAQGYLFSKPRPANEVASMCRKLSQEALADAAD
jgi:diguanylate cyclase (GGDEF)-like protein/PAS domain S-box-containing protein